MKTKPQASGRRVTKRSLTSYSLAVSANTTATKVKPQAPGLRSTERLLTLGALAVSAGMTAARLKRIVELRRLQALARKMRLESASLRDWAQGGADPGSVPKTSPMLDAWLTEIDGTEADEAELAKA